MPVYFVTGKLGSGKTLSMVGRMRDYLSKGLRVASNVDLNIRALCAKRPAQMPIRLPDQPSMADLHALGAAHDTCREELNGCIVLDECGTWLNARGWSDKGRTALIDWLLHSRKLGWDVYFIIQNASMMDKQIRDALCEYHVTCRRLDRIKIPFVGRFLRALTFGVVSGNLPKLHMASVHYGLGPGALQSDMWYYRATDLYPAYSSAQVIRDDSAGMYSLVWYATEAELAAAAPRLKPKQLWVQRVMRLPVERRIPALRTLGVV
jgi:hypothetical protein